jgi:hypothetical protein
MTSTWAAAAVALAAITLTYFICVRPHLPGRARASESHSEDRATDRQLADLRDELRALQADRGFAGGRVSRIGLPAAGEYHRPE